MTPYYKEKLQQGLEYQDFITSILAKELAIPLSTFNSKQYQYNCGENMQGVEIKFDDMYKKTGNLYIEIAEKTNANNISFVSSGIFRNDNTWLYVIGDYSTIYIFGKNILQRVYNANIHKRVEIATSKGFLINKEFAEKWALKIITCK